MRVNGLDTRWGLEDLAMVSSLAHVVDTVAVPKVESAADVWRVERHLDQLAKTARRFQSRQIRQMKQRHQASGSH